MFSVLWAQENKDSLEKKVYELNNQFKYEESVQTLLNVLQDNVSDKEKYEAAILLSNTYKRVFDYTSTLLYLNKAEEYATTKKDSITLDALEAMAYFDTQAYDKAQTLMSEIEEADYLGVAVESQSILVMQQGYLSFLRNENARALAYYKSSLRLMDASDPCNHPIVMGKMLALYSSKSSKETRDSLYQEGMKKAKACGILKYEIYLTEELIKVLDKDFGDDIEHYREQLQILRKQYDAERHEYEMRLNAQKSFDNNLKDQETEKNFLFISIVVLLVVLCLLSYVVFHSLKKRKKLEREYISIQKELNAFAENMNSSQVSKVEQLEKNEVFTERQMEVFEFLKQGKTNKEISEALTLSENTIKYHIKNIYKILKDNGVSFERDLPNERP